MKSFWDYYDKVFKEELIAEPLNDFEFKKIHFLKDWLTLIETGDEKILVRVNCPNIPLSIDANKMPAFLEILSKHPGEISIKIIRSMLSEETPTRPEHYSSLDLNNGYRPSR